MNILKHKLRVRLKSTFICSVNMFIYIFMAMMKFDATSSTGASLREIVNSMPKALQVMIGLGYYDFSTPIGFFEATFMYIIILGPYMEPCRDLLFSLRKKGIKPQSFYWRSLLKELR